jgi:hypothetical protein
MYSFLQTCLLFRSKSFCPGKFLKFVEMPGSLTICPLLTASADFIHSFIYFSFCGSIQDYKIHLDMEIVKFA